MDYLFFALTNPEDGREADFNGWYDTHHVPEVLKYGSGFLNGRRYRLYPERANFPWAYLALYTLTSDDLLTHHATPWVTARPPLTPFRGLLRDDHVAWIYRCTQAEGDARYLSKHAEGLVLDLARVDPGRAEDF